MTKEVKLTPDMTTAKIAYLSNLKPDFAIQELCNTIHLSMTQEEVAHYVIVHHIFVD